MSAIQKASTAIDTLVILRKTKDGMLASARPCNLCMSYIKESGIRKIIYSEVEGFQIEMVEDIYER